MTEIIENSTASHLANECAKLRAVNAELLAALKTADAALGREGYKAHGATRQRISKAIFKAEQVHS